MTPLRLFIVAALAYIGYRMLRWGWDSAPDEREAGEKAKAREKVEDVLVEDPVCHRLVPKHQAIRLRQDEVTHYFCSEKCCDQFTREQRGEQ